MRLCRNCQNKFNEENGTHYKVNDFDLAAFFRDHVTFFQSRPIHSDRTAPMYNLGQLYPLNWHNRSYKYRESKKWTCEKCGVNCESKKTLLHCHHIDKNPQNDDDNNLMVLCATCHQKEHDHEFITEKDIIEDLKNLRKQQGLH